MKRFVFRFLLPLAVLVACNFSQATTARAAQVTITSSSVEVNCTGRPNIDTGLAQLFGPDFRLVFAFDGSFGGAQCSSPVTLNLNTTSSPGYQAVFASVTYQGVSTLFTEGSLTFDETSIIGVVEGLTSGGDPLFTINFSGTGDGTFSPARAEFNSVPEPSTIVLLGTSGMLMAAVRRCKRKRSAL